MYLPKSKYRANYYAYSNEYVYADTEEEYLGPYFVTYNSKAYTGTRPTAKSRLIKPVDYSNESVFNTINEALVTNLEYNITPKRNQYDFVRDNEIEVNLRDTIPVPLYYPKPTPSDYTKGIVKRYFAIDKTTGQVLEISSKVYASMKAQKPEYYYPKYELKTLKWSLRNRSTNRINSSVTKLDSYLKDPSQFVR